MNTQAKIKTDEAAPVVVPDINARMVAVMRDLGAIGKDKKNEAQGFKYRGIDDVYNAINPILAKHGVFMAAEIVSKSREERVSIKEYQGNKKESVLAFTCLRMRYRFVAEDGSYVETEAEGEGMDSGDKSSNKAMAVAHKYALLQAFCIPTQDLDDPDAHVHEVAAKPAQMRQPQASPTDVDDPDVVEGVKNWVAKQKALIDAATRLPDLFMWADENCLGGSPAMPATGSILYRLKKKAPDAFHEIVRHYQAKSEALGKAQ
jgi:hypothetical protein